MTELPNLEHESASGHPVVRRSLTLAAAAALNQGLTALAFVLAAREEAVADFGLITAAVGIATLIVALVDFGNNTRVVREFAASRLSTSDLGQVISTKQVLALVSGSVWIAGALLMEMPAYVLALSVYCVTCQLGLHIQALLLATHRIAGLSVVQITDRGITAVATIGSLMLDIGGATAISLGIIFGSLISCGVGTAYLDRDIRRLSGFGVRLIAKPNLETYGRARRLGATSVITSLPFADTAVVASASTAAQAGLLGAVSRLTGPLGLVATAYSRAVIPAASAAKTDREALQILLKGRGLLVAMSTGYIILATFAGAVTSLLLGEKYENAAPLFAVYCVAMIPASINQPLASMLQARAMEQRVLLLTGVAFPLALALTYLMATLGGALYASIVYLATQAALTLGLLSAVRTMLKRNAKGPSCAYSK